LVEDLKSAEPTYSDIGATLAGQRPEGFHHDHYETVLGQGLEIFQRAVMGLKMWKAHRLTGMRVFPNNETISTDATVVVTLGTPVVALAVPCRIVSVMDGQTRWGFAYGTLPGHPEQGEEAFSCPCHRTRTSGLRSRHFPVPAIHSSGCLGHSVEPSRRVAAGATSVRFSDLSMSPREAQQRLVDPGLDVRCLTDDEWDETLGVKSKLPTPFEATRKCPMHAETVKDELSCPGSVGIFRLVRIFTCKWRNENRFQSA
jgi:uncharacterized protein (UPF0548 family)